MFLKVNKLTSTTLNQDLKVNKLTYTNLNQDLKANKLTSTNNKNLKAKRKYYPKEKLKTSLKILLQKRDD